MKARVGFLLFIIILPTLAFSILKLLHLNHVFSIHLDWRTILILVFISPILEEVIFRGLLQEWLQSLLNQTIPTIILVNTLFTILHYNVNKNFIYLITIFFCGIIFSVVKILHKRVVFTIMLHSYYNVCFIIMLYLYDSY